MREKQRILTHITDTSMFRFGHWFASEANGRLIGDWDSAGDGTNQGGFSGTIGSDNCDPLPRANPQLHIKGELAAPHVHSPVEGICMSD